MSTNQKFPAIVDELVTENSLSNFGEVAQTDQAIEDRLREISVADLFAEKITDKNLAKCCLSGLWLLHHFLDDSHDISQDIKTAEGSYWHGIMHRLEGDFGNSKYWYRQVGDHPVFLDTAQRLGVEQFDPYAFVDQCQSKNSKSEVQKIASAEWQALFEYCYHNAT
jgi:hypothetical protein